MYPPHNEGKSVIAKRFIRTLKNNISTIAALNTVKIKMSNFSYLVKKQIMMQKQTLSLNILPHLTIISLWMKYLVQR